MLEVGLGMGGSSQALFLGGGRAPGQLCSWDTLSLCDPGALQTSGVHREVLCFFPYFLFK